VILGTFPNARFLMATVYDDHLVPISNLLDSAILPLTSAMTNPMLPGATYEPNHFSRSTMSI